ncbi:MAG: HAMP domain-containing histidine kinase [Roseburia sp.]|nr:HAMP domain-containing histidine kinase [Roseburia sp.]
MNFFHGTKKRRYRGWIARGLCVSLLAALVYTCFYGSFKSSAENGAYYPLEDSDNLNWLYQSSFLLYNDLYNKLNQTESSPIDLYLKLDEDYQWLLELWSQENPEENGAEEEETSTSEEYPTSREEDINSFLMLNNAFSTYFNRLEEAFGQLNATYNYLIEDLDSGVFLSNYISEEEYRSDSYQTMMMDSRQCFAISFSFDEAGFSRLGKDILGNSPETIRKNASEISRRFMLEDALSYYIPSEEGIPYHTQNPRNCRVTYSVSKATLDRQMAEGYYNVYHSTKHYVSALYTESAYLQAGTGSLLYLMCLLLSIAALFVPIERQKAGMTEETLRRPWERPALPLEILITLYCIILSLGSGIIEMAAMVCSGKMTQNMSLFTDYFGVGFTTIIVYGMNILILMIFFFAIWYLGVQSRALVVLGFRKYIRQRCLVYRFFPFMKGLIKKEFDELSHIDLTKNANRAILKTIVINALILFVISSLWFGGLAVTVIYSVILYFILRKYISNLQKKYGILLKATNELAEGKLDIVITEDLGVFEPFRPEVYKVQEGIKKAVEEQTRSQRMKAELITNVSHDLKTPLTAIITYIDLLKDESITEEKRREYLAILERKSLRLKVLIEDLFEVSKANSQNISLNLANVDIMNLIKQVAFEMEDKLSEANLELRLKLTEEKVILSLDSQKTYRIYENLFSNIAKYALPGTRVYVDGVRLDDTVVITLKNITAEEIQVKPEELTDRFVRGDHSRHTEGSGLGLAIAKSFIELQGGALSLELDGDLFKVTTRFML